MAEKNSVKTLEAGGIEFEYDDETEEVTACRRVDQKGNVIEDRPDLSDLEHVGDGDDPTISKAMGRFEGWLENHLEWRESYRGDYYNPPEYICIGVTGCVDDDDYPRRSFRRRW